MQRSFSRASAFHRRPGSFNRRSSRGRRGGSAASLDVSRFINKAAAAEEVEYFTPEHNFVDFQLNDQLKKNIARKGYILPTPIQDKTIPHILRGSDIVGIANTGTGKTAAFLLPLIHKVLLNPQEKVLVMAPTRELAIQIQQEFQVFTAGFRIWSVCVVGGASVSRQISELRRQHNFIIGTPGRIKDLVERRYIDLSKFNSVVLDEADRMLDMGFINDMRLLLSRMPQKRQTLFFSATLSREIENLIHQFLREPIRISVKTRDTSKNIDQDILKVDSSKDKIDVLHDLLAKPDFNKVLIFGRTKHGVERLYRTLVERGFKAESIHGDKNHSSRQRALRSFKENQIQVLIATDVAARGLDVPNVSHVINYDLPATYEDYIHRIGRTGRADKKGIALTFVE